MAKPPRNSPTARGAGGSRRRFVSRYRSALEEHVHTPTGGGLGEAKELGRQASEAGISLRDIAAEGDMILCLGAGDITKWAAGLADGIAKARASKA